MPVLRPDRDGGAPHERKGETMMLRAIASSLWNAASRAHHGSGARCPEPPRRGGSPSSKTASAAARALAAAALLTLSGALALPATAEAQTVTKLVSNTGQSDDIVGAQRAAQQFTTGSNPSGYNLTSVGVKLYQSLPAVGLIRVRILEDNSGSPGTSLVTLQNPASASENAVNTFIAPANTTLDAGKRYYVEVSKNGAAGVNIWMTNRSGEDSGGDPDWSIRNGRHWFSDISGNWLTSSTASLKIEVKGSARPAPVLTAAEISTDGRMIALTFSKNLDYPTYTTTIRGAFTVTVDGTDSLVQGASGGMNKVNLSVSPTIGEGQTVVVSYDQSDAGAEAPGDSDGNKVTDFTTGRDGIPAVANNSEVDRSPPKLTGAVVTSSGVAIELAFDEDLDLPATIPAALKDAFSVTADGDTVAISSLAADGSSGLQINLSSRILKDQAVVVRYDESAAGANSLDDAAGNEVVDFTTGVGGVPAVDNDSTELSDDATLSGLSVSIQNADGDALVGVALSPAFDPGIEMYSLLVAFDKSMITFIPATNQAGATVAYFDGNDMALADAGTSTSAINVGHQVSTAVGPNTVKVKVTAPDGTTPKTYTVTVTRELSTLHGAGAQANGTTVSLQFQSDFPGGTGTLSAAAVAAFTVTADGVERQPHRRGDGDADEERCRRDDRLAGRKRHDAGRRRHLG